VNSRLALTGFLYRRAKTWEGPSFEVGFFDDNGVCVFEDRVETARRSEKDAFTTYYDIQSLVDLWFGMVGMKNLA